jgi:hypothetical protein
MLRAIGSISHKSSVESPTCRKPSSIPPMPEKRPIAFICDTRMVAMRCPTIIDAHRIVLSAMN